LRKVLSISLIFLITFNAGGYFFIYFQLENKFKEIAKQNIKEYISINELEKIILNTKSDFIDYERISENEILYHGKIYDIHSEEIRNDTIIIYCLNDKNEDILRNAFTKYLNNQNSDDDISSVSNIIKILITLALEPNIDKYNQNQFHDNFSLFFYVIYQKTNIEIPSPPPRVIS
jgi:hypothetical protein